MNSKQFVVAGLSIVALAACNKPSMEAQPAPSASAAALTDEALDQAAIPVKEDFEDQARIAITDENLEEQLDQLEKQIQDDK